MTRILTAAIIIGVLAGVLWLPPLAFFIAVAIVSGLAWFEYGGMLRNAGVTTSTAIGASVASAVAISFAGTATTTLVALVIAVPILGLASLYESWTDPARLSATVGASLAGMAWIAVPLGTQLQIRVHDDGVLWLLFLYGTVAVGDSAAYYGGSTFGRRKLAPALSPNKTVEGSLSGIVGSGLTGAAIALAIPSLTPWLGVLAGACLGLTGQAGDLLESALKRAAGVKDSSALLPGHGGVLDRIDAHLPAGAVLYVGLLTDLLG